MSVALILELSEYSAVTSAVVSEVALGPLPSALVTVAVKNANVEPTISLFYPLKYNFVKFEFNY